MVKKLSSGFEVLAFSDVRYDGMTVDLVFNNEREAQLNMDG